MPRRNGPESKPFEARVSGAGGEAGLNIPEGFVTRCAGRFTLLAREERVEDVLAARVLDERDPRLWKGAREPLGGGRGGIVPLRLGGESPCPVIVKPLLRGGILRRLNRDIHFSASRLFDEARLSLLINRRSVPASEMIFGRAERLAGPFFRLHLATAEIEHATPLLDFIENGGASEGENAAVLKTAGESVRTLHEAGIYHADLNLNNLLVVPRSGGVEVHVIDLDASRIVPTLSERGRSSNLARLLRHAVKNGLHARFDILRLGRMFMDGYCGDCDSLHLRNRVMRAFRRTLPLHRVSWRLQGISVPAVTFGS